MKVQVNVSDELVERIDNYAKMMGVSRSALCGVFIGQGIMNYDKAFNMIDELKGSLIDSFGEYEKIGYDLADKYIEQSKK